MKVKDLQESKVPSSPPPPIPESLTPSETTIDLAEEFKSEHDLNESDETKANDLGN